MEMDAKDLHSKVLKRRMKEKKEKYLKKSWYKTLPPHSARAISRFGVLAEEKVSGEEAFKERKAHGTVS